MEIDFDSKTGLPRFRLSKDDLDDARSIRTMMQSRGWKVLTKYLQVARESIIDAGKNGTNTRAKKELSSDKWSILKGFDEALALPQRVVDRADQFIRADTPEEKQDDPNDDTPR